MESGRTTTSTRSRPAQKRRRIALGLHGSDTAQGSSTFLLWANDQSLRPSKPLACSSCYRAFSGRPSQLLQCARCRELTCSVCSRTCTGCPPSLPPTPALTQSSTPSASPFPSPKRIALALNTSVANATNISSPPTPFTPGRRRKLSGSDAGGNEGHPSSEGEDKADKEDWIRGCGRTVCRNCCIESPQSITIACLDCYGVEYRPFPHDPDHQAQVLTQ